MRRLSLLAFAAIFLASCGTVSGTRVDAPLQLPKLIDGHADFALHYLKRNWSLDALDIERSLPGQADVPRWRRGGINGALVTVGSDKEPGSDGHFSRVLVSIDWLEGLSTQHNRALMLARSAADFELAAAEGRIALMPALEGGDQLDGSLANLREAHRRGLRSMIIVYDYHNEIGDGAMSMPASATLARTAHGGLSLFGREVIAEMNRLGVIIDLSHAAESTALQAMQLSKAPVIFSHSGARALADTPRNLSDDVLRAVAADGGIVMVTLVPYLTTTAYWRWWLAGEQEYSELTAKHSDEAAVSNGMAEWDAANPQPQVTISDVADQVEYVARIAGKDHVGIGTDFDGMGSFAIPDLKDAATIPALLHELKRRGWNSAELHQLARGNFLRVLRRVEAATEQPSRVPL